MYGRVLLLARFSWDPYKSVKRNLTVEIQNLENEFKDPNSKQRIERMNSFWHSLP